MAKKHETPVVETDEMKQKVQEKLVELLALGKKKKNILEYQEISDFFKHISWEMDWNRLEIYSEKNDKNVNYFCFRSSYDFYSFHSQLSCRG